MKIRKIVLVTLCSFFVFMGSVCTAQNEKQAPEMVMSKDAFIVAEVINYFNPRLDINYIFDLANSLVDLSTDYQVPKEIVLAVIAQESGFNYLAYNRSGATGLGQIIPSYWCRKFNIQKQDLFNWKINLHATIRIIDELRTNYGHNWDWIGYYYGAPRGPRTWYANCIKRRVSHINSLFEKYEKNLDDILLQMNS